MSFVEEMNEYTAMVDSALSEYIKKAEGDEPASHIFEAMDYALFPGGKRVRPLVLLGVCAGLGGDTALALPFACALEMIHGYSLIHDDLPAMDDDDVRRGKPSCHIQFGEAAAILAGDGLLNRAFEVMSEACVRDFRKETMLAMNEIASAAGVHGMVGGQAVDLEWENKRADKNVLLYIHINKTARLFSAAAAAGAFAAGINKPSEFRRAGELLGLAFQIMDDILDETADEKTLGKPVKSDEKNNKNTYVSVHGLECARTDYKVVSGEALRAFTELCGESSFIAGFVKHMGERRF